MRTDALKLKVVDVPVDRTIVYQREWIADLMHKDKGSPNPDDYTPVSNMILIDNFAKQLIQFMSTANRIFEIQGNNTTSKFNIIHNKNDLNLTAYIIDKATKEVIYTDFKALDKNTMQISFKNPIPTGITYEVMLEGGTFEISQ